MSTSANVMDYIIRRNGKEVGRYSQNLWCHYAHHQLLKYEPREEFTIQPLYYDEDEVLHEHKEVPLKEFLQEYYDMGQKYRQGCTIEEVYNAPPKPPWNFPDLDYVKANRQRS